MRAKTKWWSKRLCIVVLAMTTLSIGTTAFAEEGQQAPPEYVDPNTGVIHQFSDGFGNYISREQFVRNVENGARMIEESANREIMGARQYLKTASNGADTEITQGVINGLEQAKQDTWGMSNKAIANAKSVMPVNKSQVRYEKPKVLVSG